jgi:hypothetical protein
MWRPTRRRVADPPGNCPHRSDNAPAIRQADNRKREPPAPQTGSHRHWPGAGRRRRLGNRPDSNHHQGDRGCCGQKSPCEIQRPCRWAPAVAQPVAKPSTPGHHHAADAIGVGEDTQDPDQMVMISGRQAGRHFFCRKPVAGDCPLNRFTATV